MTHSHSPRTWTRWVWIALPVSMLVTLVVLVVAVTGFFRLSRDARCLRDSLVQRAAAQSVSCHEKLELSVGALTCQMLRVGLSFAPLQPEARAALRSVRGAEVGVYHLDRGAGSLDHGALLIAADEAMSGRGWERLVGVAKEGQLVAVYIPKKETAGANLHACVAVLNRTELIVVSARSNLAPLMELALNRPEWQERNWANVRL